MKIILKYLLLLAVLFSTNIAIFAQMTNYVYVNGKSFYLNGQPFFPVGTNYEVTIVNDANGNPYISSDAGYNYDDHFDGCGRTYALNLMNADFDTMASIGINCIRVVWEGGVTHNRSGTGFSFSCSANTLCGSSASNVSISPPYSSNANLDTLLSLINDILTQAAIYHIKVMLLSVESTFSSYRSPTASADYAAFLKALAINFATNPTLYAYDLNNEPGTPQDTVDGLQKDSVCYLTRMWYDTIKYYAPNQLVTIGDLGSIDVGRFDPEVMNLDFVCFHPYPGVTDNTNSGQITDGINRVLSEIYWYGHNVTKPWMLSETGFSSPPSSYTLWGSTYPGSADGTLADQATFFSQSFTAVKACGGAGYMFWQYGDEHWFTYPTDNRSDNDFYGITDYNGNLKQPGATAIKNFNPNAVSSSSTEPPNYYNYYDNTGTPAATGTVVDNNGNPIKGAVVTGWYQVANVYQPGTEVSTFTQSDGSYTLNYNTNSFYPFRLNVYTVAALGTNVVTQYTSDTNFTLNYPTYPSFDQYLSFSGYVIASSLPTEVAYDSISAGPSYIVNSTGNITLEAGESITLTPGFDAQPGSHFDARYGVPQNSCSSFPDHAPRKGGSGSAVVENNKIVGTVSNNSPLVFLLKEPDIAPAAPAAYVSPNPTIDGQPSVYLSNPSEYSEITVSNMLGQVIQHIDNPAACNKLNISANARGVYIVKVSGQKNVYITKIIYE